MGDLEKRIRQRAYQLWQEEGCPEGRAQIHWEKAAELIAIEDNQRRTRKPIQSDVAAEPVAAEPLDATQNQGKFPTRTDQGEGQNYPSRRPRQPTSEGQSAGTSREPARSKPAGNARAGRAGAAPPPSPRKH